MAQHENVCRVSTEVFDAMAKDAIAIINSAPVGYASPITHKRMMTKLIGYLSFVNTAAYQEETKEGFENTMSTVNHHLRDFARYLCLLYNKAGGPKTTAELLETASALLVKKGKEYGSGEDRFAEINEAVALNTILSHVTGGVYPTHAVSVLTGYMMKHVVSVNTITIRYLLGEEIEEERLEEKIVDLINYLILIYVATWMSLRRFDLAERAEQQEGEE